MNYWPKSSYSSSGTNCVELAADLHHIRDSKNVAALLAGLKSGRLAH
jgi:hypothetical protein